MSLSDPTLSNEQVIEQIFEVFRERGDQLYGEDVSEKMHAVQCGQLAEQAGHPPSLVVASFLHDIGHLMHNLGEDIAERGIDARHEVQGEAVLHHYFPESVTEPVRLHVAAKRYLCTIDPEYRAGLSEASERSLRLQGGTMTPEEVAEFEAHPFFKEALELRKFDDLGKDVDAEMVEPEHFRAALEAVILPEDQRRD